MANDSTGGQVAAAAVTAMGNMAITAAANKKQYRNQMKAMAQQQAYNKELWDYQNAYNTPQMQMQRLEAAGLNPHLIYGSGAGGAGNAGPISPTEVPTQQATRGEVPDIGMRHLITRQMDAQYAATRQNIENAKIKAILDQSKTALENLKVMREDMRSKNYKALADAEVFTQKFIAARSEHLSYNTQWQNNLMDQMYDFRSKSNPQQLTSQGLDNTFKENRNALAALGIYQSDHPAFRILISSAKRMGIDLGSLLQEKTAVLKQILEYAK